MDNIYIMLDYIYNGNGVNKVNSARGELWKELEIGSYLIQLYFNQKYVISAKIYSPLKI